MKVFTAKTNQPINYDSIREALDQSTHAVVRGLFDCNEVVRIRSRIQANLNSKNDIKHDPKDLDTAKKNIQKLIVGGSTSGSPRFVRKYYTALFNEDIYGAHTIFRRLIIQKSSMESIDYAMNQVEDGAWSCPCDFPLTRGWIHGSTSG